VSPFSGLATIISRSGQFSLLLCAEGPSRLFLPGCWEGGFSLSFLFFPKKFPLAPSPELTTRPPHFAVGLTKREFFSFFLFFCVLTCSFFILFRTIVKVSVPSDRSTREGLSVSWLSSPSLPGAEKRPSHPPFPKVVEFLTAHSFSFCTPEKRESFAP